MKSKKTKLGSFIQQQSGRSRRETFDLVKKGAVKLNNVICKDFSRLITPQKDSILIDDSTLSNHTNKKAYYIFNKPKNVISTVTDPKKRPCLKEYMIKSKLDKTIFPVGRLDRATTGLMIFTNDGDFANRILHPKYELKKIYKVIIDKKITKNHVKQLLSGVILEDGPFNFDKINLLSELEFIVSLHEGRNRIIRRAFSSLGYTVTGLKRLAIGQLELPKMKEGQFKTFNPQKYNL